jgi:hypothetical protein
MERAVEKCELLVVLKLHEDFTRTAARAIIGNARRVVDTIEEKRID